MPVFLNKVVSKMIYLLSKSFLQKCYWLLNIFLVILCGRWIILKAFLLISYPIKSIIGNWFSVIEVKFVIILFYFLRKWYQRFFWHFYCHRSHKKDKNAPFFHSKNLIGLSITKIKNMQNLYVFSYRSK